MCATIRTLSTHKLHDDKHKLEITVPMLNSAKLHKERVTLSITCDGPVDGLKIGGRGENWTVRFIAQPAVTTYQWLIAAGLLSFFVAVIALLVFMFLGKLDYGFYSVACVIGIYFLLHVAIHLQSLKEQESRRQQ